MTLIARTTGTLYHASTRKARAGLLVAIVILLTVTAVWAHEGDLLRSDPVNGTILADSPEQIRTWFNEELQTQGSTLQVFDAGGQRVDGGGGGVDLTDPDHASMKVSLPPLPEGAYLVRWYVVLLDGDATESVFNFYVGDETAASAAGFEPADTTVLYYQAESEVEDGGGGWLIIAAFVGVALATAVPLLLRRKPEA